MPALLPDGTWVSDDGQWRLLEGRWHSVPPALPVRPGPLWFLGTQGQWVKPMLLTGLISLLPIVGYMNLYGWSLITSENLRLGYRVPAPASFKGLERGWRFGVWGCGVGLIVQVMAIALALVAAAITNSIRPGWVWPIAVAIGTYWTVLALIYLPLAPTTVPVLLMTDSEGFSAATSARRVAHAVRRRWDAAWFGVAILALWAVVYFVAVSIGGLVPFFGPLMTFAAAVPGYGLLGLMLAAPLARADDPPSSFPKHLPVAMAAGYAAVLLIGVVVVWAVCILAGSVISAHPEESACFFNPTCDFSYAGDRETITNVDRNGDVVTVRVKYINRSEQPAILDSGQYWVAPDRANTTTRDHPSTDCAVPESTMVPAGGQLTQVACFHVRADDTFQLHIPWTGWDSKAD